MALECRLVRTCSLVEPRCQVGETDRSLERVLYGVSIGILLYPFELRVLT